MKMRPITAARWSADARGRGQAVDARRDQCLQRVGDALEAVARTLREHAHGLLDEERVALGLRQHGAQVERHVEIGGECSDELGALVLAQRLELDRRRAHAAAAPRRADVEQLGAGEADDEQRRVLDPRGEMLDQLEQRLLAPMRVLEDEDERLRLCELRRPRARGPRDLALRALALDGGEHADGEPEEVGDLFVLAVLAELLLCLVDGVVVADSRGGLHHFGERPVRDALAVRERAAEEHGRALDAFGELAREAALADTGIAVDREERRAAVADRARIRVLEQLELRLAADERRLDGRDRRALVGGADDAARRDRVAEAAQLEEAGRLELDTPTDETRRAGADEDLPRLGALLQPRGEVDGLARGEGRRGVVGDDLAGLDSDAGLEAQLANALERRQRGTDRALGVVLVRERHAEGRHDGVPGELLDGSAVRDDAVRDLVEEPADAPPDDLGIGLGDELGRADEVHEENGCELALHALNGTWRSRG